MKTKYAVFAIPLAILLIVQGPTYPIHAQEKGAACSYSVNPTSDDWGVDGGNAHFYVYTDVSMCPWVIDSSNIDVDWLHITSGGAGTGAGTVHYHVDANPGFPRTGHI